MMESFLRRTAVEQRTGLSRTSIYAEMAKGTFPRPVRIGVAAVGWLESEVVEWMAARIAERDKGRRRGPL